LDKFYTLVRFVLREVFAWIAQRQWRDVDVENFNMSMRNGPLGPNILIPEGLRLHVLDIYLDEIYTAGGNTVIHARSPAKNFACADSNFGALFFVFADFAARLSFRFCLSC
jgi:hypothetical protein